MFVYVPVNVIGKAISLINWRAIVFEKQAIMLRDIFPNRFLHNKYITLKSNKTNLRDPNTL